nr:MAG TPA: minor capsid protein [Caudoviricetes sp.]
MTALESLNLAAPIADAYMSVEERLLVRIARQLSLNDDHQLNEVSRWQIKQLAKHGLLRQDAHKIIAAGTKGIPGDVAETVRQAIDDTLAEDGIRDLWHNEGFSESAKNAVKHYRAQAKDVYNQVNTVMKYKAESTFVRAVNSVAEKWTQEMRREQAEIADKQGVLDILNSNTAAVVSGAESRTKAVRTTIHEMAQKGIPAFVDKSGREWSPEAYVNMDIRATVKNTALEAQFSTMDSLGQDVFEVSSHPGSRPKCRPWQGKLISRSGKTTEITDINGRKHKVIPLSQTSFGEPDGLFGINCGHRPRGVSDGLFRKSSVEYDDTEDKELYNKVCRQRELERRVRKSKTEADMLEAAGDTEGAKEVRRKMAEQNKALKSYCDSNGLKYRSDRVKTYGSVKPSPKRMSNVGNTWAGAEPTKHTATELAELNQYAADKGIKLYTRKPFDGDAELLKSQIDTVADLREEFKIKEPLQLGWKRMDPDDFGETSPNHQQIWINELAIRNRSVTEKNLAVDNYLATNSAEGIAAHEMGHVISGKIRNGKSGLDIYKETVYNVSGKRISDDEAIQLLLTKVSVYSAYPTMKSNGTVVYGEVISEMLSINYTSPNKYSSEFVRLLKEACGL